MSGLAKLKSSLAVFWSATRVAAALENSRRPDTRDLRRLGIDPQAFSNMGIESIGVDDKRRPVGAAPDDRLIA